MRHRPPAREASAAPGRVTSGQVICPLVGAFSGNLDHFAGALSDEVYERRVCVPWKKLGAPAMRGGAVQFWSERPALFNRNEAMIHSDAHAMGPSGGTANLIGRYRLLADIGRGGMAEVYLAVTENSDAGAQFQKLLVVKMLKEELGEDPEFVRMFLNEARLAARLNHPNIVQTLEIGTSGNRYFLAMEYLEGQPLHRVLRNLDARANLSLAMRLHILVQALSGLHYAHERQDYDGSPLEIVHRDVSPSNLFVTYDGQVKLVDFGIAKARDSDAETRVGVFKGKAAYIAPEQMRGDHVDRRADIYSAGVLLWELMTGRRLWAGLSQTETLKHVLAGDLPSPRTVEPRLPVELERICMKALSFRPEDRHSTAEALAGDLERAGQLQHAAALSRDLAAVVAQAFTEDRARIQGVIEIQLTRPNLGASLPALDYSEGGRSASPLDSSGRREHTGATAQTGTLAAPMHHEFGAAAAAPLLTVPTPRPWGKVALGAGLAVFVSAGAWLLARGPDSNPTPPPAKATPVPSGVAARGVSPKEIQLGMSAVFSGASRELGQNMKLGIETRFRGINDGGGIHGRKLSLIALDDGYEATRAAETMKALLHERRVFAILGNVGTPTAAVAAPLASSDKTVFFGAFTGAPILRQDPPDRYVFNYRASYQEETAKSIKYLLEVRKLAADQIVVFAQEDSYGDAGFEGVQKALRANGRSNVDVLRTGYKRNTVDVDAALMKIIDYHDRTDTIRPGTKGAPEDRILRHPVKAVVMVATYRAAARFIQRARANTRFRDTLFFNVSFVGSETLAEELKGIQASLCPNVFVTQVVPHFNSGATGVRFYREQLQKYEPQAQPGFVSLEGFIVGSIFANALERAGASPTSETLVGALEGLKGLDLGIGTEISYSMSEHQGSHKVWGTALDANCAYQTVDLD